MAGDWIKMRHDLCDDPACLTLSDKMSDSIPTTVGRLHFVWSWMDRHTSDGVLKNATKKHIDRVADKEGFADALIDVGWLVDRGDVLEVPHFTRHNGNSARARELEAEAKRLRREEKKRDPKPVSDKCPTLSDKTSDQRREEKSINKRSASASKKVFRPPSLDDVRAYCRERSNRVDPELFIDHYTANGWKQSSGIPIRDWKAAVRTWERNKIQRQQPADSETPTRDLSAMHRAKMAAKAKAEKQGAVA